MRENVRRCLFVCDLSLRAWGKIISQYLATGVLKCLASVPRFYLNGKDEQEWGYVRRDD